MFIISIAADASQCNTEVAVVHSGVAILPLAVTLFPETTPDLDLDLETTFLLGIQA
jgi:hypothetical protein